LDNWLAAGVQSTFIRGTKQIQHHLAVALTEDSFAGAISTVSVAPVALSLPISVQNYCQEASREKTKLTHPLSSAEYRSGTAAGDSE